MQFQLIANLVLGLILSTQVMASAADEKEIKSLFDNYSKVMDQHKVELVGDVFSEKFIKAEGGKDEFSKSVKQMPLTKYQRVSSPELKIKPGTKSPNIFFVKTKEKSAEKGQAKEEFSHSDFVIVRENGKLKIDGTISDGE